VALQLRHDFFYLESKLLQVTKIILFISLFISTIAKAQKVDSIYVNLYTDSLKKGTFNYINVDGLQSNGRYIPLDSTYLNFTASAGHFAGNSLWIDKNFTPEKVHIKVTLRRNPAITKEFDIWIKKRDNVEALKTADQLLNEMQNQPKAKSKKKN
jgi:hypothetical protein